MRAESELLGRLGGVRAERGDGLAEVAPAEFVVGGDGYAAGRLGELVPAATSVLNVGEYPGFGGGLCFDGVPAAGEVAMPGRDIAVSSGSGFVLGADGVDAGVAGGGAGGSERCGYVRGRPGGFAFVSAAA